MWVYVNYPNPRFTLHRDPSCQLIQMHGKPDQRVRGVTMHSLNHFLSELLEQRMRFAAESGFNDLWLEVQLDTPDQEIGLVHVAQALLGGSYRPLASAPVKLHCR